MVAKGHKDSHRYTYSSGVKAQEVEKWGRDTAARRYGEPRSPNMKPKDMSQPQDPVDQAGDKTYNDVSKSSWLRGGGESGKPKR
jgi:hypothetical protein